MPPNEIIVSQNLADAAIAIKIMKAKRNISETKSAIKVFIMLCFNIIVIYNKRPKFL